MAIVNIKVVVDKNDVSSSIKSLQKDLNSLSRTFSNVKISSIDSLQRQTANLLNNIKGIEKNYPKGAFDKLKTGANQLLTNIKTLNAEIGNTKPTQEQIKKMAEYSQSLGKLKSDFATTRVEGENFHGSLKDLVSGFGKFQLAAMLVMKPLQLLRSAWSSLNEVLEVTESRAVAIARVLKEDISANQITSDLYHLAQEYGQTFDNVQELATNFARSGLDWTETIQATQSALLALNVAELDATQASEGLLAIMTQFGYEAEDLLLIVDKLNITADNANVTTEKLLKALQRTGSSAKNAKLDLEETVGIITALSEATNRSGENLGTAVNSLIQFSTKASSLETFSKLGGDVEKAVENYKVGAGNVLDIWTELSDVIKNNTSNSEGILSGLFSDDDWRALNEELQTELGENFATVTEIYDTASTFRKNYFIALLNNMDQVESTMKDMEGANGYSQKENLEYLDTYESKMNSLTAKWQELANDEQGFLAFKKGLVDAGLALLNIVDAFGGLKTISLEIAVISATAIAWFKPSIYLGVFNGIKSIIGIIPNAITAWKAYSAGIVSANTAMSASIPVIGLLVSGITLAIGAINSYNQAEADKKIERLNNALSDLGETSEKIDKAKKSYEDLVKTITTARAKYDEAEEGTVEYIFALAELNTIQEKLAKSENKYGKEIDIVNGKIEDQIELLKEQYGEEIKKLAFDYLVENADAIDEAKNRLNSTWNYFPLMLGENQLIQSNNGVVEVADAYTGEVDEVKSKVVNDVHDIFTDKGHAPNFANGYIRGDGGIHTQTSLTSEQQLKVLEDLYKQYEEKNDTKSANYLLDIINRIKADDYTESDKLIFGDEESSDLMKKAGVELIEKLRGNEITVDEFLEAVFKAEDATDGLVDSTNKLATDLSEVSDKYNDIVAALEKARDLQKEAYEFEEKKKAVLEAEKALEEAQKNRLVKVYNSETGDFDYVSNEKEIQKAREQLEEARKAVEESATDEIEELLKNKMVTNEDLDKLFEKWSGAYGSGDFSKFVNAIAAIIKEEVGIDINAEQPTGKEVIGNAIGAIGGALSSAGEHIQGMINMVTGKKPTYDSGGVLHGLGGIKATAKPETVLDPSITAKILEPTSNAQFTSFANSLGLLFGVSRLVSPSSPVQNNHSSNDSHDNHYTINGVPVPVQMAENHSIRELFDLIPLV